MTDHHSEIAGLLQSLEHSLEAVDRLSTVVEQFTAAEQSGAKLAATTVDEDARQMITVRTDTTRMRELLTAWWQMVGQERAQ